MFSCRACVPRDRETDTVKVDISVSDNAREHADAQRERERERTVGQVIERWDAGEGRFVELREGDRLLVGAPTRDERQAEKAAAKAEEEQRERYLELRPGILSISTLFVKSDYWWKLLTVVSYQ
eukprot:Skav228068  [mRNA]  locus=scaffold52:14160:16100:+ [translate_table: standard]